MFENSYSKYNAQQNTIMLFKSNLLSSSTSTQTGKFYWHAPTQTSQSASRTTLAMFSTTCLLSCCCCFLLAAFVASIELMFERFEQINGTGIAECNVRVRKFNRTTASLLGNVTVKVELDNSFQGIMKLYHSPLGNNQFVWYPFKIGPMGVCDFTRNIWPDFYDHYVNYVENLPEVGECPVRARTSIVRDFILDGKRAIRSIPEGLWKVQFWLTNDEESVVTEVYVKVYKDGYFLR